MDSNLVILSLDYTYLVSSHYGLFESNTGLWQHQSEWSKALIPYTILEKHQPELIRVIDNLNALRNTIMSLNHNGMPETNHVKLVEPQLQNQLITISINGNETFINNCRTEILKSFKPVGYKAIELTPGEFGKVGSSFLQRLKGIAMRFEVEIMISDCVTGFHGQVTSADKKIIYILGVNDNVNLAETYVHLLMHTYLAGCLIGRVKIPLSLIPTLGGVGLANFRELVHGLDAKLYLPDMMPTILNTGTLESNGKMSIWIASKSISELKLTTKILSDWIQIVDPKTSHSAKLYSQKICIPRDKLDLISLHYLSDVHSIMLKHATYIQIPTLGEAGNCSIVVQGPNANSVQETISEIAILCCEFYRFDLTFLRGPSSADLEYYLIKLINLKKTCILTYNEHGMSILGKKDEIHLLLNEFVFDLQNSFFFSRIINEGDAEVQIALSIELGNEHKEFLSGKKNGKISKILTQLGNIPHIRFDNLNSFNFVVHSSIKVNTGSKSKQMFMAFELLVRLLKLVELELPAELQFNIPDVFHKSIIGNGGSIIQSIMKKYNVFIKFSRGNSAGSPKKGSTKKEAKILYSFRRDNNVLIKCPMKNQKNIKFVKYEIDQLVRDCSSNSSIAFSGMTVIYNTVQFKLLKNHYLSLVTNVNYNLSIISELEDEFNTYIDFPRSIENFGSNSNILVTIKGNETNPRLCADKLTKLLPKSYEVVLPVTSGRISMLFNETNREFKEAIIIPLRLLLKVEVVVSSEQKDPLCQSIVLSSYSEPNLCAAVSELCLYLTKHDFTPLDARELHFNPIALISEVISPTRSSNGRHGSRSPRKSPSKTTDKPSSPCKSPSKPLGVITNTQQAPKMKFIPNLNSGTPHQSPTQAENRLAVNDFT